MASKEPAWSRTEFEAKLRERGRSYHIHHPFNVMLNTGKATPEQERWVSEHQAEPKDGLAWTGDPVEGVDTLAGPRQATRDTDKAVKR